MDPRLGGDCEFKYHWAKEGLRSVAIGKILELILTSDCLTPMS